jgi:putative tryptophan/tyrosine transport system substrate-binding protein
VERLTRRYLLQSTLALVGCGLLAGCELPRLPWQKVSRIGFLGVGTRESRRFLIDGLVEGLREHGYEEGKSILIEYRFSEGRDDRLAELAAELIAVPVDLIVASGSAASFAAADATETIPIVMGGLATDPVASGLVNDLAQPSGNITGMSMISPWLSGKRLQMLKETIPGLSRVAHFWNPTDPTYDPVLTAAEADAQTLGLELRRLTVRAPADLEGAFQTAARQGAGALITVTDALVTSRPTVVAALALNHRMPTMMENRELVAAGALLSLGPNFSEAYRQAATHVDKILKGADPANLPMEQPTKFDLAVNLNTAGTLGLTLPQSILDQATEIIQ